MPSPRSYSLENLQQLWPYNLENLRQPFYSLSLVLMLLLALSLLCGRVGYKSQQKKTYIHSYIKIEQVLIWTDHLILSYFITCMLCELIWFATVESKELDSVGVINASSTFSRKDQGTDMDQNLVFE